ncbi:MAG: flippase-like domain-containing protein [Deltaproteobacteria bacterium]|nr:flippase-like domain-containing protein [Deltaproteobacteria bacterium]
MKKYLNLLLSVILGILFLYLTFKGVDTEKLIQSFSQIKWTYIVFYLFFLTGIQIVRTTRWGVMLRPIKNDISFKDLYIVSSVGFMALVTLPLGLGEFARPYLIYERCGVSMSAAMATIVVERVIDGITIGFVFFATWIILGLTFNTVIPPFIVNAGIIFFVIFVAIFIICMLMYLKQSFFEKVVRFIFRIFSHNLAEKIAGILNRFIYGLKSLPDIKSFLNIFFQSMIYWGLNATGLYLMFYACGLLTADKTPLPYIAAYVVLCMQVIGITIPSGPAFVGPFDFFTLKAPELFVDPALMNSSALLYVFVVHTMQFLQQTLYGIVFVFTGSVSFRSILSSSKRINDFLEPT